MNKQSRLAPAAVPAVSPDVGAAVTSMPCRECDGKGEAEYLGLTDSYYRWADCHKCFGSGVEPWYCETCGETLKADGFCVPCDDWGSLIYVERIAPGRVAL